MDALIVSACLVLAVAELGMLSWLVPAQPPVTRPEAENSAPQSHIEPPPETSVDETDDTPLSPDEGEKTKAFITLFGSGTDEKVWYLSDFDNSNSFLGVDWRQANIKTSADGLTLAIREKHDAGHPWSGSEIQSRNVYSYGRYEVAMRPARGSGLVSSFFTYTGPHFGTPHDEIDIEFLGLNTRQVQFNYFRKGKTGASMTVDLPFDAADDVHLYAFEWRPDGIEWFIDGESAYHTPEGDRRLPVAPGKIILNLWTGKPFMSQWHGAAAFKSGSTTDYACVSYKPLESPARSCSTFYLPRPEKTQPEGRWAESWLGRAAQSSRRE